MRSLKVRLITLLIVAAIFVLVLGIGRATTGAGVYFENLSNDPLNYNDSNLTADDFKKNIAMEGNVYWVLDCIGEEYTETTSRSGNVLSTQTDAYIYAIPFDDSTVLLFKTDAESELEELIDALYVLSDPYYEEYKEEVENYAAYESYEYLLEEGAAFEGVLVDHDEEIVDLYEEWKTDYPYMIEELFNAYGLECNADELVLLPYTLDCTKPVSEYTTLFFSGVAIILVFVVIIAIAVVLFIKSKKGGSGGNNQFAPVNAMGGYDNGYNQPNFNQQNQFGQTNSYQPNSYQQNNYQSNVPQPTNSQYTAQPQQNNNYGRSYIPNQSNGSNNFYNSSYIPNQYNDSSNSNGNSINLRKD